MLCTTQCQEDEKISHKLEKIFTKHVPEKGLTSPIYKDLLKLNNKKNEKKKKHRDFLGGPVVKNLPASVGNTGSVLGLGIKLLHSSG